MADEQDKYIETESGEKIELLEKTEKTYQEAVGELTTTVNMMLKRLPWLANADILIAAAYELYVARDGQLFAYVSVDTNRWTAAENMPAGTVTGSSAATEARTLTSTG